MKTPLTLAALLVCLCTTHAQTQLSPAAPSQAAANHAANNAPSPVDRAASGDSIANPGPLAIDLSGALESKSIRAAMRKVATWQMGYIGLTPPAPARFNQQWTMAALYSGLLAYSADTGDHAAHDAVLRMSESFHWQLIDNRFPHADDEALGRAYLDLYAEHPTPERIAHTRVIMDRLIARPDDAATDPQGRPVWWWCDALYMAPPVLVRLSKLTGDRKYIAYMDHEWAITSAQLYDPQEHLFFRDSRFFTQHEANGKKLFWSRGNGWVLAALVDLLTFLPADDPLRPRYTQQFRELATRIASLQGADGLWRTGLLDAAAYPLPEVSGSAFFTEAFAYGIRTGLLDRATFEPVLRKSWSAMVARIYADGRLGSIQPVGAAPDSFQLSSSYVYGVGAFLLAGTEIDRMLTASSTHKLPARPIRHPAN